MPNAIQEKLLKQPALKLSDLRKKLVGKEYRCSTLYNEARAEWGAYFQSPVDKTARTLNSAFKFNEFGAFLNSDVSGEKEKRSDNKGKDNGTDFETAKDALFRWLKIDRDDSILAWLREGTPLSAEKLDIIKRRLRAETLTNESLYDQPICRLVHRDQLRRDLDYQVVYQVTPGQSKLLNPQQDPRERKSEEPPTQRLKRSQKAYWGISETFQSLVAMFDSDLGTWRDPGVRPEIVTKEFIRIIAEKQPEPELTPDELNIYSPLRFWSPPPAFAGSVFHMLFWRALITGKDLFGREVIKSAPQEMDKARSGNGNKSSIAERARHYYVVINWFNAAKFRLAAYDRLFETLMAIASFIGRNVGIESDPALCEIERNLLLRDQALDELLYPNYGPHTSTKFREFPRLNLQLPFKAVDKPIWELAWSHQIEKDQPTQISHLLKFLRDKALELIIWSKYQMEIRSVGLIPCQYLYRIELDPSHTVILEALRRQFEEDKEPSQEIAETPTLLEKSPQPLTINQSIVNAIENKSIEDWIILKRVCGGTNRTIFDKDAWGDIKCLESPRAKTFSSQI